MSHYKKLKGKKCYLSLCSMEDAEKWTEWDNDLEVSIPLGDEAYTPNSLEKIQDILGDVIKRQNHIFNICDLETDVPIGRCMFFEIDQVNRRATLGILIREKGYWGRGYGKEATRLLLDYGFNLLNLNNIMLGTFSFNQRALACFKQVGFKEIGRRREARIIGERKYDLVLMDMLSDEFDSTHLPSI